jgi:general secretion pathway protein G
MIFALVGGGCLLVGLFLAGIIAAILIPNFLDALQKAKQKRTVADMRTIGAALESYAVDNERYPEAADAASLVSQLAGHGYGGGSQDGWKNELRWTCLDESDGGCSSYELASGGRDGAFESEAGGYEEGAFVVNEYDSDLVLVDGLFVRWPESQGRFGAGGEAGDG